MIVREHDFQCQVCQLAEVMCVLSDGTWLNLGELPFSIVDVVGGMQSLRWESRETATDKR